MQQKLKDLLPFVFPVAAMILVVVLAVRWYRLRNETTGQISQFAEGVPIEDLSQSEMGEVIHGVGDVKTAQLTPVTKDDTMTGMMGDIRYEIKDGKVRFTVQAALPDLESSIYQVWLKEVDGTSMRKAFVLQANKGGYVGSAAISADTLPFEVVVSREAVDDDRVEEVLMNGTIQAEDQSMMQNSMEQGS